MISLHSLRTRLGLLLVLAFAPIFGLTAYWSYLDRVSRLAALDSSASRLALQVAATYEQVFERSHEVLLTLSRVTEIRQLSSPRCGVLLAELLAAYRPQYQTLGVARADGQVVCSAVPLSRPINVRQGGVAFRRAVATRRFAVGDFILSKVTGRPALTMALPIIDERGDIIAVIGSSLSIDWLNQLAAEFALQGTSLVVVVDRSGRVVVHQPDPARWIGRDVSGTPLFAARLRGETRFETTYLDGVRRRFAIAAVRGIPHPSSLAVGVGIDQEEALAAFHLALYRDLAVLFVVAFAAFAAAWFGTERSVIRRVNALLRATRRVAAGDLGARAGTGSDGPSELRQLGRAFDDMATTLEQRERQMRESRKALAEAEAELLTVIDQDITARKQAETALHESEERFRNMAENLPMILWLTDPSASATYISHNWYAYTGQTPAAALGFGWLDAVHPDDGRSAAKIFRDANAKQLPFCIEYRLRRQDGEYRHFIDSAAPRLGPLGEFLGYVGCVIDIHDRKQATEHFRLAVEAAPSAMIMADERGVIRLVNSQAEQLFGYTRAELLGQSVEQLLPERARAAHLRSRGEFFLAPDARTIGRDGEIFGVRKDGFEVPVEIGLSPIRTDEGGFVLVSITDITERKRVEETRARLEAQLRQAQKMEALGTLAGGIAHDFNNILSAIIGNVDLAVEDVGADHPAQENLAVVRQASERARDLVQQILTFSRQRPVERRVVQLRHVAEESVKLLRATLPAGIELVITFAPDTPPVLADRTHIHQVLMNLCANAWQAIEEQVGRIDIALAGAVVEDEPGHAGLRAGRYARLTVVDSGKGMDRGMVERIFDPFFTTKALGEGTGLGLAVVDGIVKSHDGAIEVLSAPGLGTTFHLYFPAVEVEAETVRAAAVDLPRGGGQRILYLDDEAPLVAVAKRLLGRLGYEVVGFTSPADALAAFRADPAAFDLCVTDLNMPAVSGIEIAAELLRLRPALPVALASGNVSEALRTRARALGVREVIYKPSTLTELAEAIHRMCTGDAAAP